MNPNQPKKMQSSLQSMLSALAEHQQLQTAFAQSQQQVSLKIEQALLAMMEAIRESESAVVTEHTNMDKFQAVDACESGRVSELTQSQALENSEVLENESGEGRACTSDVSASVVAQACRAPSEEATTSSPKSAPTPSLYKTIARPLGAASTDSKTEVSTQNPKILAETSEIASMQARKAEVESSATVNVSRSLYRTLAQEQTYAESTAAENSNQAIAVVSSFDFNDESSGHPKRHSSKDNPIEVPMPGGEVQQIAESTLETIESLLPTVEPFEAELGNTAVLAKVARELPEESAPHSVPVRKSAGRTAWPQRVHRDSKVEAEEQETVTDTLETDSSDERSLMEQIHRFTETLSESKSFWKQVTVPKCEGEAGSAAKSLDPTARIAAQYENVSRSPYSH